MKSLMPIHVFSTKTGIPKSTLRFYESKNLLKTVRNEGTNYRMYSEDQVPLAKLIASLRTANIPIRDIQLYLEVDENRQEQMKQEWIYKIKEKQKQLEISRRYLESDQGEETFYMLEKSPEQVIWFEAESPSGQFKEAFILRREQLEQCNISINNTYLRYLSGNRKSVKAEIGFGISDKADVAHIPEAFTEKMIGSLCICLTFKDNFSKIETGYRKLIRYCMAHNWTPVGSILEWYRGDQMDSADIIVPVTQKGGE
ncbi:helix-turn-helix domain-containing protein [Virgibacillus kimchii]